MRESLGFWRTGFHGIKGAVGYIWGDFWGRVSDINYKYVGDCENVSGLLKTELFDVSQLPV